MNFGGKLSVLMSHPIILTTPEELKTLIGESVRSALSDHQPLQSGPYLGIDEAAAYLNLKKQTLYGFTSSRSIPFLKRAKRLLFLKDDLDAWLAQGRRNAEAAEKERRAGL